MPSLKGLEVVFSIHRSHIIWQHEHERANAGSCGAGKDSAAQDFDWSVVGEGETVLGGAEGASENLQFFVAAGELNAFDRGGRTFATTEEHEEFGAGGFFRDFAQVDSAQLLQILFVLRYRGIYLGVSAG